MTIPRKLSDPDAWLFAIMVALLLTIGVLALGGCKSVEPPSSDGLQRTGEGLSALKADHNAVRYHLEQALKELE